MNNIYKKLSSLDYVFLFLIVMMTLCYLESEYYLDLLYLLFLVFSYIRLKVYRWKKNH